MAFQLINQEYDVGEPDGDMRYEGEPEGKIGV